MGDLRIGRQREDTSFRNGAATQRGGIKEAKSQRSQSDSLRKDASIMDSQALDESVEMEDLGQKGQ